MPTPFTHLACARRLLDEGVLPGAQRELLRGHLPAFMLGSIAADGHTGTGIRREDTHFYSYDGVIETPPAQVMLTRYPELTAPEGDDQRAFVAGYVGHLAVDEAWAESMMRPWFIDAAWGSSADRFLALNLLLIGLDERDRAQLGSMPAEALSQAEPQHWLPFLPDAALCDWRAVIVRQLAPGAASETLRIISPRVGLSETELRALADSPAGINARLWAYVPRAALMETEAQMNGLAREQVRGYLGGG